jgi:hypothetical protein
MRRVEQEGKDLWEEGCCPKLLWMWDEMCESEREQQRRRQQWKTTRLIFCGRGSEGRYRCSLEARQF